VLCLGAGGFKAAEHPVVNQDSLPTSGTKLPEMSCTCKHCPAVLKDIRIARDHHARCPGVQGLQCSLLKGAACDHCFTIASAAIRFNELVPIKALDLSKSSHEAQVCRFFGLDFLFFNVLSCIRSLLLKERRGILPNRGSCFRKERRVTLTSLKSRRQSPT
jgi:hypothetical protein